MRIKSTRTLSHTDALDMYIQLLEELYGISGPSNKYLEDALNYLQDTKAELEGTTNFDNYNVVDDWQFEQMKKDWKKY